MSGPHLQLIDETPEAMDADRRAVLCLLIHRDRQGMRPPTHRELCDAVGFRNLSAVRPHLDALEAGGWITRVHNRHRGITLTDPEVQRALVEASRPGIRLPGGYTWTVLRDMAVHAVVTPERLVHRKENELLSELQARAVTALLAQVLKTSGARVPGRNRGRQ
jgi:SOS-response transcriptional repressor LexA